MWQCSFGNLGLWHWLGNIMMPGPKTIFLIIGAQHA